jgi:hypothetical protein
MGPIRLFIILNFPSIVKDELAVLQQRAAAQKLLKPSLHLHFIVRRFLFIIVIEILSIFLTNADMSIFS